MTVSAQRAPESPASARHRPVGDLVVALFGPIVWAAHFSALYLAQSGICTVTGNGNMVRWFGAVITAIAVAALLGFVFWRGQDFHPTHPSPKASSSAVRFSAPLAAVSIFAVVLAAVPIFLLPACSSNGG